MVELHKNLKFDPKQFVKTLPQDPGVYRMLDENEKFLYVGKAKNLKKRVSTYFSKKQSSARIAKMLTQTCDMEIVVTNTEAEALLLIKLNVAVHHVWAILMKRIIGKILIQLWSFWMAIVTN